MEIEKAKAIRSSGNWEDILKELDVWINNELQKTKICTPEKLIIIQTTISAFEKVKSLPTIVIDAGE